MRKLFVAMLFAGALGAGLTYAAMTLRPRKVHLHCFAGRCITHAQLEAMLVLFEGRNEEQDALLRKELLDEGTTAVWFDEARR